MVLVRSVVVGTVLRSDDLKVVRLPSDALPGQWFPDSGKCVDQTLGFGLEMGTVLQPGMLAASLSLAERWPLAPVLVRGSSLRSSMSPGTPIILVLTDSGQAITADAQVSAMPGKSEGILLNPSGGARPLILVDVPAVAGPKVSAPGQQEKLMVILGNESQSPQKSVPIDPCNDESRGPGNPGSTIIPVPKKTPQCQWCYPIDQSPPLDGVWGRKHWLCPTRSAQSEPGP